MPGIFLHKSIAGNVPGNLPTSIKQLFKLLPRSIWLVTEADIGRSFPSMNFPGSRFLIYQKEMCHVDWMKLPIILPHCWLLWIIWSLRWCEEWVVQNGKEARILDTADLSWLPGYQQRDLIAERGREDKWGSDRWVVGEPEKNTRKGGRSSWHSFCLPNKIWKGTVYWVSAMCNATLELLPWEQNLLNAS